MPDWSEKVVVVAGGSKGLGMHIARAFHSRGSRVVILARDPAPIEETIAGLEQQRTGSAFGFDVDLTNDARRKEIIRQIANEHCRIDVWVNAIGQSIRGAFETTEIQDYRRLMDQNFFASVGGSLDAIPHLEKSDGCLVNIGSLASKTAWPYIAPYVTSKHALAGFAGQLRLEGPKNIHYLFVCPGPIQAKAEGDRYGTNSKGLPEHASRPGAGAPVKAMDPDWLAEKIVDACVTKKTELVIPLKSRLLFAVSQLFPTVGDKLIRRFCK